MSVNNDEKDTTTQVKMVDATTSANVGPGTELIPGTELMEDCKFAQRMNHITEILRTRTS